MKIYWKALLGYGFVFWIVLCITDFLGITHVHITSIENGELYHYMKPSEIEEISIETSPYSFEYKGYKLSWPQLIWNTLTFVVSILLCSIGRAAVQSSWEYYQSSRCQTLCSQIAPARNLMLQRSNSTISKIPVKIKSVNSKGSEVSLKNEQENLSTYKQSCPNLLNKSRENSLFNFESKKLKTLYSNDSFDQTRDKSLIGQLEKQINHYKEEFIKLQSSSLKEHAALSRKLEQVYKERADLLKKLSIAQKETRGAKQQLEELLQEKTDLLKKIEQATKELKANTKTKKVAFAKLEEVTSNIEELRVQLEQVSRDKEILKKKLCLMENEYNKLHERYIAIQEKVYNSEIDENVPERDKNNNVGESSANNEVNTSDASNSALRNAADALASVSQTQLDMEKIQAKIKQLEQNLEKLNYSAKSLTYQEFEGESELSLSTAEGTSNISLTKNEDNHFSYDSEYSGDETPKQEKVGWPNRVVELIGMNTNKFEQIQNLARKLHEKTNVLDKLRYDSSQPNDSSIDDESYSDEIVPSRIVSNSTAFKNFLKALNTKPKQFRTTTEVLFK